MVASAEADTAALIFSPTESPTNSSEDRFRKDLYWIISVACHHALIPTILRRSRCS